ncbi:hypothetical protein [Streptomonospora salina]|uniref:Uncharacterized protein n=1 Tax=Streptomonospora salina TaxID=104205 RepID=A0A841E3G2_9ACTN|nr:hypothetical protein [Streptomonospora salina]MBB5998377.1 hypothetical protein [Streptomonospora salina]
MSELLTEVPAVEVTTFGDEAVYFEPVAAACSSSVISCCCCA